MNKKTYEKCPLCAKKGAYKYGIDVSLKQPKPRDWYTVWVCRYCNYYERKLKPKKVPNENHQGFR